MQRILLILALFAGITSAADRPVLVLSGTGQYQPLASGDNYAVRDAANAVLGTGTGTKWGTATSQKQAWYNATPVIQQTGDVATALVTYGLITSPTISATTAIDSTFRILGSGDATKKLAFEVDAQTAGKVLTIDTGAQTVDRTATFPVLASDANIVVREAALTDNAAVRADGTTGKVQDSLLIIADNGNASVTTSSNINLGYSATVSAAGTGAAAINSCVNDAGNGVYLACFSSTYSGSALGSVRAGASELINIGATCVALKIGNNTTGIPIKFGIGSVEAAEITSTANSLTSTTLAVKGTTASTSTSTGALVVGSSTNGGLGVAGAVWIGGAAQVATAGKVAIGGGQVDVTTAIGLRGTGSDTIASSPYMYWNNTSGAVQALQLSASNHLDFWSNNGSWAKSARMNVTGEFNFYSTTDSSSTTTGSISTLGGISYGTTKSMYGGAMVLSGGATAASLTCTATTGTAIVATSFNTNGLVNGINFKNGSNGGSATTQLVLGNDAAATGGYIFLNSSGNTTFAGANSTNVGSANALGLLSNNLLRVTLSGANVTFEDAINMVFNTSTGTKIGTGTTQKIGFWNATPIAQKTGYGTPTGNVQTANFPGATATLLQTSQELAQLLLDLKAAGIIGN